MTPVVASDPIYSIVVPVYNSRETLEELAQRLIATMVAVGESFEIILVNDGSADGSWEVLRQLPERDARVRTINFMRNFGQHSALMCGFRFCRGRFVITLDDDLQHPPEEIPKLIQCMRERNCDAVIARYAKKQHAFYRNFGTWMLKQFTKSTLGIPKHLDLTSFRLMKRAAVDALLEFRVASPRVGLMLCGVTKNLVNVETRHDSRKVGRSGYSLRHLVSFMIDNTLSYSSLPLRMTSWLGFSSAGLSVLVGLYFLAKYLAGGTSVSGFTTIVLLVSFFSGAILMTLGIVGEYLVRIIRAAEMKPLYVVSEVCHREPSARVEAREMPVLEPMKGGLRH